MIAGGVESSRIEIVHSGIAIPQSVTPRDWRKELNWPGDSVIAGVVGAMTAEKGVDSLGQILELIPASARKKARILFLGGSHEGSHEIGGVQSHFAGFVTEIENAIAGLDILLHPSSTEGLGTSIIDAMAQGVPPVAFQVGGIPEVIEHEVNGLLAPSGDSRAFATNASRLVSDPELRARLGESARNRARQFDASAMTKGTEAVYYEVLRG
jgi:glycosyltransferase involved in cell wall biosynthesis